MDIMTLVFVVFMDIHYCFCFHGCTHASIHNGNQVLANIGKEPTKKEVRREFCAENQKNVKNGRFEIKVIVLLPPIAFSAQPRSRPDRPGRKMPQQVQK